MADGDPIDTATLGTKTFSVTATDNAGNQHTRRVSYRVADQTEPTVTITTPAQDAIYAQGAVVNAEYTCDDGPGSGIRSCVGTVADDSAIDTATAGTKTFTVTATDNADNTHTKEVSYTVADQTKPTVTISTPLDGATYTLGQSVLAAYECADPAPGSGIKSCTGTVVVGAALDTATVGTKKFTVTATDNADNTLTKEVSYTVAYRFGGFLSPIPQSKYKAGSTIPLKFKLTDAAGTPIRHGRPSAGREPLQGQDPVQQHDDLRHLRRSQRHVPPGSQDRQDTDPQDLHDHRAGIGPRRIGWGVNSESILVNITR